MIQNFFFFGVFCALIACSGVPAENPTDKFLQGEKLSKLKNTKLGEISGGAASVNNPGLFWLHNDSGNPSEIYLVDDSLNILLTCSLEVKNRDWEDMAIGPGPQPGKNYIYLGEIGDNHAKYEKKYVYRFEEPKWNQQFSAEAVKEIDTISFILEGENKDIETLMIDPFTKDLYIISKREDPVWLYQIRFPYPTDSVVSAKKLYALPFTQIVSGEFSPDGKKILIKNYEHVYYWENTQNLTIPELLKQQPLEVRYELEPQGETIIWARDGSGFYTVSEKNAGKNSYLYLYKQKNPAK